MNTLLSLTTRVCYGKQQQIMNLNGHINKASTVQLETTLTTLTSCKSLENNNQFSIVAKILDCHVQGSNHHWTNGQYFTLWNKVHTHTQRPETLLNEMKKMKWKMSIRTKQSSLPPNLLDEWCELESQVIIKKWWHHQQIDWPQLGGQPTDPTYRHNLKCEKRY